VGIRSLLPYFVVCTLFCLIYDTASYSIEKSPAKNHSEVGMILSMSGSSRILAVDGSQREAKVGMLIQQGDRIDTARSTSMKIIFLDRSTITLGSQTDLTVNDYFYDGKSVPRSKLTVKHGFFEFVAGKMAEIAPENFVIETETATIGIRGSGGSVSTSDGKHGKTAFLEVATIEGHVLSIQARDGKLYLVEDPNIGLKVNAAGIGEYYNVLLPPFARELSKHALAISAEPIQRDKIPTPQPSNAEALSVEYFLFRKQLLRLKCRVYTKINGKNPLSKLKGINLANVLQTRHLDTREINLEPEKASAHHLLKLASQKLLDEKRKGTIEREKSLSSRDIQVGGAERSSSYTMMQKMAQKQKSEEKEKAHAYAGHESDELSISQSLF
jgi:hypothetical protein